MTEVLNISEEVMHFKQLYIFLLKNPTNALYMLHHFIHTIHFHTLQTSSGRPQGVMIHFVDPARKMYQYSLRLVP